MLFWWSSSNQSKVLFNMWTSFFPSWLPSDDVPDVSIPVGRDQHQSLEHSTQESLERSLNASSTQNSPAFSQEATLEHPGSHPGRLGTSIIYLFAQGQRSPREAARCTARLELHLQLLESTCRKNQPYKSIYQHWLFGDDFSETGQVWTNKTQESIPRLWSPCVFPAPSSMRES